LFFFVCVFQIINDRETGRSRGFEFVTFSNEKSMRDAIEGMNNHRLIAWTVVISPSTRLSPAETVEAVVAEVDTAVVEAPKLKKTL
jgi:RNA recognition motif-containing protein